MKHYSEKKKFIFALLISSSFIVFSIAFNYFLPRLEKTNWKEIIRNANKKIYALAWDAGLNFFPRYPQRLNYIAAEISKTSGDIAVLIEDLSQATKQCDCSQAQSQCSRAGGGAGNIVGFGNLLSVSVNNNKNENKKNEKLKTEKSENRFQGKVLASLTGQENSDKWNQEFQKVNPEGTITDVKNDLKNIKDKELKKLNEDLKNLPPGLKGNPQESVEQIKKTVNDIENNLKNLNKDTVKELKNNVNQLKNQINTLKNQIENLPAQFKGQFKGYVSDLKDYGKDTINKFENIFLAANKCGPAGVIGDPCKNQRKEIKEKQLAIKEKAERLSYLRELIKKENQSGLEEELKTLDPEDADKLRTNLENLLNDSGQLIKKAKKSRELANECSVYNHCSASCAIKYFFSLKACLQIGTGEQKSVDLKFKAKVGLDDLDLGKVGINFNLALPKTIDMPELGKLSGFAIAGPKIVIPFPETTVAELKTKKIEPTNISPINLPSLPKLPSVKLSCPETPEKKPFDFGLPEEFKLPETPFNCPSSSKYKTYSSIVSDDKKTENFGTANQLKNIELSWYFQSFSWLAGKCQKLPGMKKQWTTKEAKNCFNPDNVHITIIQECDSLWQKYNQCLENPSDICKKPSGICASIGMSGTLERHKAYQKECANLFQEEKKPTAQDCYLNIVCSGPEGTDCHATPESVKKVLNTLKNECSKLKEKKVNQMPESCKFIPLFTGKIEEVKDLNYEGPAHSMPAQKVFNYPSGLPGCGSFPTIPKIKFPKIIIPDICMPSFNIPPFICVKLPNFIFEDLVLPDIDLCNLDKCKNIWPTLNLKAPNINLPTVKFPPIQIPPIKIGDANIPFPDIRINPLSFPSIPFSTSQLPSLGNFLIPKIQLPSIPLPKPKFQLSFEGIDTSVIFSLIETFILNAMDIPDGSFCKGFSLHNIACCVAFPDYEFKWPQFPEIPQIPFCKDIDSFCDNVKKTLGEGGMNEKCKKEKCGIEQEQKCEKNCDKTLTNPTLLKGCKETCQKDYGNQCDTCKIKGLTKKIEEIEEVYNNKIGEIQEKIDSINPVIEQEIKENIQKPMNDAAKDIGNGLQEYVNQKAKKTNNKITIPAGSFNIPSGATGSKIIATVTITKDIKLGLALKNSLQQEQKCEKNCDKTLTNPTLLKGCKETCQKDYGNQCDTCKKEIPPKIIIKLKDFHIPSISLGKVLEQKCEKNCDKTLTNPTLLKGCKETCQKDYLSGKINIPWPKKLEKIELNCDENKCDTCKKEKCGIEQEQKCEKNCDKTLTNPTLLKGCKETCQKDYGGPCEKLKDGKCNTKYNQCKKKCLNDVSKTTCKKECSGCLEYELPIIPLCDKLSYEKEFPVHIGGFQPRSVNLDLSGPLGNVKCLSGPPTGGNPCPNIKTGEITALKNQIEKDFQNISNALR